MAYYWTGGFPKPHAVREISAHGALVVAPGEYCPGTIVRISLEDAAARDHSEDWIPYAGVWGVVLRNVSGGFCVEFLFEDRAERTEFDDFLAHVKAEEAS